MKAYSVTKVSTAEDISKLYEYIKLVVKDVEMYSIGDFVDYCLKGRAYIAKNTLGEVIGGLLMMEYYKYIYIAYFHVNSEYRVTSSHSIARQLYDAVCRYSKDKSKDVYTKLNDYSYNIGNAIEKSDIDGLHKINIGIFDVRK